jgi:hypothetical protein
MVTDQQIEALAERLAATERAEGHEASARTWEGVAKRVQRGGVRRALADGVVVGTWRVLAKRSSSGGWYRVECIVCGHATWHTPGQMPAARCVACAGKRKTPAQLQAIADARAAAELARAERLQQRKARSARVAELPAPKPPRGPSELRRKIDLAYEPAPLPEGLAAALDDATRRADRLRAQLGALDVIREVAAELAARGERFE